MVFAQRVGGFRRRVLALDRFAALEVERLIAVARLVIALAALLAMWLEPTQPVRHHWAAYGGLGVYVLFAALVALLPSRHIGIVAQYATHVVDLGVFSTLMLATGGPASPYFVCFVFLLFTATLRWSWRGAAATAVVELLIYGIIVFGEFQRGGLEMLDSDRMLMRATFLALGGFMLVSFGRVVEGTASELGTAAREARERGHDTALDRLLLVRLSSEQLIAYGRLTIAVAILAALLSNSPADHLGGELLLGSASAFLLYAAVLAWLVTSRPSTGFRIRFGTHLVDTVSFAALVALTDGPESPFFVCFTFLLLVGTIRWDWRGAAGTAGIVGLLFLLVSMIHVDRLGLEAVSVDRVVMRLSFLFVGGAMLAYFGVHRESSRSRAVRLFARSPVYHHAGPAEIVADAAEFFGAARIVAVWGSKDESSRTVAVLDEDYQEFKVPARGQADPVSGDLATAVFACRGRGAPVILNGGARRPGSALVLEENFRKQHRIEGFASAPLGGSLVQGRIFVLDPSSSVEDNLWWLEVVAARLSVRLDAAGLERRIAASAVERERIRTGRDLHDGVLQGLSAVGMHLKALALDPGGQAPDRLEHVRRLLLEEHRRLRRFVLESREIAAGGEDGPAGGLFELVKDLGSRWGLAIEIKGNSSALVPRLGRDVRYIVSEAVANAARHGKARRVEIAIDAEEGALMIHIKDDGRGIAGLNGTFEIDALKERGIGPASLLGRVQELGGGLRLSTSPQGLELMVSLPL